METVLCCIVFISTKDRKDYQQVCKVLNCVQLKQTLADLANLFCCRNVLKHVQAPLKKFYSCVNRFGTQYRINKAYTPLDLPVHGK